MVVVLGRCPDQNMNAGPMGMVAASLSTLEGATLGHSLLVVGTD